MPAIYSTRHFSSSREKSSNIDSRFVVALYFIYLVCAVIVVRLFVLMVLQHDFYLILAAKAQDVTKKLIPERGSVFIQDSRTKEEFGLAINGTNYFIFADTKEIFQFVEKKQKQGEKITYEEVLKNNLEIMSGVLKYDELRKEEVKMLLQTPNDPYIPLEQKTEEKMGDELQNKKLPGLHFVRKKYRLYPEGKLASQIIGFVGKNEKGEESGRYGIEGYWEKDLAGTGGFLKTAKSATGWWVPLAGKTIQEAEDGVDLLLTIDRTLQFKACEELRKVMELHTVKSASLIIMDPFTGAIRAMCSFPDFDPNNYGKVESIEAYNNTVIFTPYEPGSIFKPIGMSAAINEEVITPETVFHDPGIRKDLCSMPITNANNGVFGDKTMTGVLEKSINTGIIFVTEKMGKEKFVDYVEKFGFGIKEGLELDSEQSGVISSLYINKKNKVDCYTATASYGQGIMVTPLQMAAAYSVIANGGILMKPYVVEEIRHKNGKIEKIKPKEIRPVLNKRTASLVSGMLVSTVDNGYDGLAKVPGYYVAGKTGTAQIADSNGYLANEMNHSFAGFAPVEDPKFVMVIKLEKPHSTSAALSTAPLFGNLAKFILQYYQVQPTK